MGRREGKRGLGRHRGKIRQRGGARRALKLGHPRLGGDFARELGARHSSQGRGGNDRRKRRLRGEGIQFRRRGIGDRLRFRRRRGLDGRLSPWRERRPGRNLGGPRNRWSIRLGRKTGGERRLRRGGGCHLPGGSRFHRGRQGRRRRRGGRDRGGPGWGAQIGKARPEGGSGGAGRWRLRLRDWRRGRGRCWRSRRLGHGCRTRRRLAGDSVGPGRRDGGAALRTGARHTREPGRNFEVGAASGAAE